MKPALETLLERFIDAGDLRAMEEIVRRTRPRLLGAARRIGAAQDAEDTAQNAYHSLLRRAAKGPLDAPVLPWLLLTTVRIAYRRRAVAKREAHLADRLASAGEESDPGVAAARAEEAALLREEVARLPATYRDIVVLHHFEGLTTAEIARLLDMPVPTVKSRIQRGRFLLKGRLAPLLLYLLYALPWRCADAARTLATGTGVMMKAKSAVVVALVAALLATGVGILVHRAGGDRTGAERTAAVRTAGERVADEGAGTPVAGAVEVDGGVDVAALPAPVDFETEVDMDRDLHGTVVDRYGAAVAGADLRVVAYPWRRTSTLNLKDRDTVVEGPRTRSARDGTFRLRLRRGALVNLRVAAEGYAPAEFNELQAGERARIRLTLRGVHLDVVARDAAGAPVADARLRIFPRAGHREVWYDVRAQSGEDGRCRFADLPAEAKVWLETEHEQLGNPSWLEVDLPAEGARTFEVTLPEGRTITGRVTDAETGAPVVGATVGMGWTLDKPTKTDGDGRYVLHGWVGEGTHSIAVHAPGYGQTIRQVKAADEVDFRLKPGGTVTGLVVDAAGRPLAGVCVAAVGSAHTGDVQQTSKRHTRTGSEGRFSLDSLRPDIVHALTLFAPGYGRTMKEFRPGHDFDRIVLAKGGSIEGVVRDASGAPLPRVPVELRGHNDDRYPAGLPANRLRFDNWYGATESRRTDHLGRFRFPDLAAPGTYELTVKVRGRAPVQRTVKLAGEDLLDVELRFRDGRELTVWVHDDSGLPLKRTIVTAHAAGGSASAETGPDGRAVLNVDGPITHLYAWPLPVRGEERDFVKHPPLTDVAATRTELRITIARAARIEGEVVLPEGGPLEDAVIEARAGGERVSRAYSDAKGRFSIKVPRAGRFDLVLTGIKRAMGAGWGHDTQTEFSGDVRSVAPGARDVQLRVVRDPMDRSLTVRVERPDKSPATGVRVYVFPAPRASQGAVPIDEHGVAVLTGLPAREMQLRFLPPLDVTGKNLAGDLVMPAGRNVVPNGQEIHARLEHGVATTGVVLEADGLPAPVGPVHAYAAGSVLSFAVSDAAGRFTIYLPREPVSPIRVRVAGNGPDGKYRQVEAEARPGAEIRLQFGRR